MAEKPVKIDNFQDLADKHRQLDKPNTVQGESGVTDGDLFQDLADQHGQEDTERPDLAGNSLA